MRSAFIDVLNTAVLRAHNQMIDIVDTSPISVARPRAAQRKADLHVQ